MAENLIEKDAEKPPNVSIIKGAERTVNRSEIHKGATVMKLDSIHIKDEHLSIENKTGRSTEIKEARQVFIFLLTKRILFTQFVSWCNQIAHQHR